MYNLDPSIIPFNCEIMFIPKEYYLGWIIKNVYIRTWLRISPMNGRHFGLFLLVTMVLTSACTLMIGGPSQLPDAPAPTAIPVKADPVPLGGVPGKSISLPPGFEINLFADNLDDPRMMTLGPDGHIYVADRGAGRDPHGAAGGRSRW